MAASTPPVGLDHPTVVPTNFEHEDGSDSEESGDGDEMSAAECQ